MVLLLFDEVRCGQVAVAVIGQEGYDSFAGVFRAVGNLGGCIECSTAGDTDEQAFFLGEGLCCVIGLVRRDGEDFVVNLGVQCFRYEVGADALEFVRAGMAFGQERGISRFDGYDLDGRFLFFEVLAYACEGAACADTGDEDIDLAVCIFIDFRARRFFVSFRVYRVGKCSCTVRKQATENKR